MCPTPQCPAVPLSGGGGHGVAVIVAEDDGTVQAGGEVEAV